MSKPFRWTLELCQADAAKYETRSAWKKQNQPGYAAAKRNGWFEQCVSHMGGNKQWTKVEVLELALRHETRNAFKHGDPDAYRAAGYNGWLEEACAHMTATREQWTLEKCKAVASNYSIQNQWKRGDRNSYFAAYRNGWIEECCAHMDKFVPYSFEECHASALKFETRVAWKVGDTPLYAAACRNCWIELCTEHMGVPNTISTVEGEVFEFVQSICPDAIRNNYGLLGGRFELDIFIPSMNIGIEYNGLAWHSERTGRPVGYHQNKSSIAASLGVRLIHIWSDEWLGRKEVVKAYLSRLLGVKPERELFARKCDLVATTGAEQRAFLESNHIQGFASGDGFALSRDGEVLAVALIKINRNKERELVRLCFKIGVEIHGGFEKLMAQFKGDIVSFCDTAKFDGSGYLRAGWVDVGQSHMQIYWVNKNCDKRINRANFSKADWLKSVTEAGLDGAGKSEVELAAMLGFHRMGGCKLLKFVLLRPSIASS
jgi:hypothetical protein